MRRGGELVLLDELFASARGSCAALVLTASASPAEAHLPLGLVSQLLSGAGRFGEAGPPQGADGGPGVSQERLARVGRAAAVSA